MIGRASTACAVIAAFLALGGIFLTDWLMIPYAFFILTSFALTALQFAHTRQKRQEAFRRQMIDKLPSPIYFIWSPLVDGVEATAEENEQPFDRVEFSQHCWLYMRDLVS